MARRLPETLADYLVLAVCPTLIGLLVGSLMFFLVEVFYQGEFQGRLLFVMAMFVMAIVGIARIAMVEGMAYASLFALPLGLSVGLALARFVPGSAFFSWALMALVWWATHKLTWDCTLVDDAQDASGQGLLQQMGIEESGQSGHATQNTLRSSRHDLEGTTSTAPPAKPWWDTLLEPDHRPHAPGVWVIYFSLAALPLFGIGGWFVVGDPEVRWRVFHLLVVYMACGMSLLLATSFLGLRRYLRQRRLEMPLEMTATWITAGLALILLTLFVAAVLPRPRAEHSLSQLPATIASSVRKASRFAVGPEGVDDAKNKTAATADAQKGQPTDRSGSDSKGASASASSSNEKDKSSGGEPSKQNASKGDQSESQKSSGSKSSEGGESRGESGKQDDSSKQGEQSSSSANQDRSPRSDQSNASNEQEASPSQPPSDQASPPSENSASGSGSRQSLPDFTSRLTNQLGATLKWLFYAALCITGLVLAWKYRQELLAAWCKLLNELRELWEGWFGRRAADELTAAAAVPLPPRPFAAFADPFASGAAARMSWPELIRYTFDAAEAWAREHNCPREPGQTPLEFAHSIGSLEPAVADSFRSLASWYSQLAYAPRTASRGSTEPLRQLWRELVGSTTAS